VALYGYTAMIEERMKSIKNEAMVTAQVEAGRKAEPQVVVKQVDVMGLMGALSTKGEAKLSDFATPVEVNDNANDNANENQNSNETTMEANNMKAADLIGKTIIVGENIATITIKSVEGETLKGEFKKAGDTIGMPLPITMENLKQQIAAGAWRFAEGEKVKNSKVENETNADEPTEEPKAKPRVQPKPAKEIEDEEPTEQPADDSPTEEEETVNGQSSMVNEDDPVLKQWHEAKAQDPDAIIIFRNANIFVVVADDAEQLSKVAELKCGKHGDTAICIFPKGDLSAVMMKAVGAGLRVKMEDLQQPKAEEAAPKESPTPDPSPRRGEEDRANGQKGSNGPSVKPKQPKPADAEVKSEKSATAEEMVNGKSSMVNDKKPSDCTAEPEEGKPRIIDYGKSIVVAGDTSKIEAVLLTLWGRKRPYTSKGKTYSGIQLSAKHKKTVEEVIKLAS